MPNLGGIKTEKYNECQKCPLYFTSCGTSMSIPIFAHTFKFVEQNVGIAVVVFLREGLAHGLIIVVEPFLAATVLGVRSVVARIHTYKQKQYWGVLTQASKYSTSS